MEQSKILGSFIDILRDIGVRESRYKWIEGLLKAKNLSDGLTYSRLAELMRLEDPALNPNSKQAIKRHLKALSKAQDEQKLIINKSLLDLGFKYQPSIEKVEAGGGSGNTALYEIKFKPIPKDDQLILSKAATNEKTQIEYELKEIKKLPIWSRPFSKIKINGSNLAVYKVLPLTLSISYLIGGGTLVFIGNWLGLVMLTVIAYLTFKVVEPFYQVLKKGIILAPAWLLPINIEAANLITYKSNGSREIILTYYEGECPICSGKLNIVAGDYEFKGRFIGRCENSGREHIFSFDHITKFGLPLRKEYSEFSKSKMASV